MANMYFQRKMVFPAVEEESLTENYFKGNNSRTTQDIRKVLRTTAGDGKQKPTSNVSITT